MHVIYNILFNIIIFISTKICLIHRTMLFKIVYISVSRGCTFRKLQIFVMYMWFQIFDKFTQNRVNFYDFKSNIEIHSDHSSADITYQLDNDCSLRDTV